MALDIKKLMRGLKFFNNATQADSVQLTVSDSYSGNYEFEFPNTGSTTGQQVVTTASTQTLSNKTITLTAVTPNRVLHSDGAGTIVATEATYSDSASDVTLDITTARDFVINGKSVRVPIAASEPSGVVGDIFFDSTAQQLKFYNSGGWQALAASASANQTLSNLLAPTAINQNLLPDTDVTRNIGSASFRFQNLFANSINDSTGNSVINIGTQALVKSGSNVIRWGAGTIDTYLDTHPSSDNALSLGSPSLSYNYIAANNIEGPSTGNMTITKSGTGNMILNASNGSVNVNANTELNITAPVIKYDIGSTSDPGSPVEQEMYYNTTNHRFKYYNGSAWKKIADTSAISARYSQSTNQAIGISGTSINFQTQIYDTNSLCTVSPWTFTASIAGVYDISAIVTTSNTMVSATLGDFLGLGVKVNGTLNTYLDYYIQETSGVNIIRSLNGSATIKLNQGDTVQIGFYIGVGWNGPTVSGSAADRNNVSISFVGE